MPVQVQEACLHLYCFVLSVWFCMWCVISTIYAHMGLCLCECVCMLESSLCSFPYLLLSKQHMCNGVYCSRVLVNALLRTCTLCSTTLLSHRHPCERVCVRLCTHVRVCARMCACVMWFQPCSITEVSSHSAQQPDLPTVKLSVLMLL